MTSADIQNHLERYLKLRRSLGFEMRLEGRLLQDFLTFLQGRTLSEPLISLASKYHHPESSRAESGPRRTSIPRRRSRPS